LNVELISHAEPTASHLVHLFGNFSRLSHFIFIWRHDVQALEDRDRWRNALLVCSRLASCPDAIAESHRDYWTGKP
jgi:hypothetical protein